MKLFEEYPDLTGERIRIRHMAAEDAPALQRLAENRNVYRYLPTFLYEQKYEDKAEVIARMDEECFRTKDAILLGIYLKPDEGAGQAPMIGIAEIYNYEEKKGKASIGCRLDEPYWGKGLAAETVGLLKDYLMSCEDIRTITAHVMRDNIASAKSVEKNGFLNKYPGLWGDWGLDDLCFTDKFVFKKSWLELEGQGPAAKIPPMDVEQFVMAYRVEQDRIRAMLPEGYVSLRPVLRINAEIRDDKIVYVEFNTPVEAEGRKGWLNIDFWKSTTGDDIRFSRESGTVRITAPFLEISYTGTGMAGGCPAEKDNEGTFYIGNDTEFRPAEKIEVNKEFCDCSFAWHFHEGDACGSSEGRTLPAFAEEESNEYSRMALTAENAAAIPCRQVLGTYIVRFERVRAGRDS